MVGSRDIPVSETYIDSHNIVNMTCTEHIYTLLIISGAMYNYPFSITSKYDNSVVLSCNHTQTVRVSESDTRSQISVSKRDTYSNISVRAFHPISISVSKRDIQSIQHNHNHTYTHIYILITKC